MKNYVIILTFLFSSVSLFCQIKGQWRQVFPENPPGPRYRHYMCPIGDQKVLMIGGLGDGNPYNYSNETWLYDYPSNTWTRVQCDTTPDIYQWTTERDNCMSQISKNRAIVEGGETIMTQYGPSLVARVWLFDLDSMRWFRLNDSIKLVVGYRPHLVYLEENLTFNYEMVHHNESRSWLMRLHPEELLDSPDLITKELINDESITKQGPYYNEPYYNEPYSRSEVDPRYFTYSDYYKSITYIPAFGKYQVLYKFMNMKRATYEWLFVDEGTDTLPWGVTRACSDITDDITLLYNMGSTYSIEYFPETNLINTYKIVDCNVPPENEPRLAKVKNGVVMLFGGWCDTCNYLSNETWVFELDTVSVTDNYNAPVRIYEIGDNVYLLDGEIKDASLYNLLGQKIMDYRDARFNLNNFPIGVYFLHYTENNTERIIKLLKK